MLARQELPHCLPSTVLPCVHPNPSIVLQTRYIVSKFVRRPAILMESVQYGLDALKTKALDDIRTKLTSDNIMIELFSTITSTCVVGFIFLM